MPEKPTIPLTERRPQANRPWILRVRRDADGRAIHGVYATNFQNGQAAVPCWTPERISRRQSTA